MLRSIAALLLSVALWAPAAAQDAPPPPETTTEGAAAPAADAATPAAADEATASEPEAAAEAPAEPGGTIAESPPATEATDEATAPTPTATDEGGAAAGAAESEATAESPVPASDAEATREAATAPTATETNEAAPEGTAEAAETGTPAPAAESEATADAASETDAAGTGETATAEVGGTVEADEAAAVSAADEATAAAAEEPASDPEAGAVESPPSVPAMSTAERDADRDSIADVPADPIRAEASDTDAPAEETRPTALSADRPASFGDTGDNAALERILARQRGEVVDDAPRTAGNNEQSAGAIASQLAANTTDSDVYRAIRYGTDDVRVTTQRPESRVLIQTGGMRWLQVRGGPLLYYGGIALLAVIGILAVFYLLRGRIRIDGGRSGLTVLRFTFIERFAHWLLAGSFILLALSGLIVLFGRDGLIPLVGHDMYALLAAGSKWVHNNVAWPFMLGLVLVFFFWVWHNIPNKLDWNWVKKAGGLLSKNVHPPAKKFNAGQKLIFWGTIILGASISASGLSLLFPFELPMFAKTFEIANATGIPGLFGSPLPVNLAPHEEMQLANLWHAIVGFLMMMMVLAHIYLGSIGMEGAFDAMGSGEVDRNWAAEHHSLWLEDKESRARSVPHGATAPAE